MVGLDIFNGSINEVRLFKIVTGVSFPLLLKGAEGGNFEGGNHLSRNTDDVVIIDQNGVARFIVNFFDLQNPEDILDVIDGLLENHQPIRFSLDSLYFGQSLYLGQSRTLSLNITNNTTDALEITGIRSLPEISLSPPTVTVPAGQSKRVTLTLTPVSEGTISGTVQLLSNRRDLPSLQIRDLPILPAQVPVSTPADPRADFDGNRRVDFEDFLAFVQAFNSSNPTFDVDNSGHVDFADFVAFTQSFGKPVE